jgi:3-dehydroquinate synthase
VGQKEQIFIGENSFQELTQFLTTPFSSYFVLVDENTLAHCYPQIQNVLPKHSLIQIQSGEQNKTIATCSLIWTKLTEANADRRSLLLNLGGGVIGDMGGFAAACYKRGISFVNIPTTLLSMVDASVGGKTGIDFMGFKNQLGLFQQPEAVFIDTYFLKTLPKRELLSGFAEVIKHYLIADRDSFYEIQKSKPLLGDYSWHDIVKKSIEIKTAIVEQDPHEKSIRKALNFGHTIGHAAESCLLKSNEPLLHGEAVALGMITESYISLKQGLLPAGELNDIATLILSYFNLPAIKPDWSTEISTLIKQDKKNEQGIALFTLLQGIGKYSINNAIEESLIIESLNYYNSLLK